MRILMLLAWLLPAPQVFAHGAIHDQLKSTDERIRNGPNKAELYIHRGRLYLDDGHLEPALADFRQALKLDPNLRAAHYFLAGALLNGGDAAGAEQEARAFIARLKGDDNGGLVRGYRLLGESLMDQQQALDAAAAYRAAIDYAGEPAPDQYIECAAAYLAAGPERRESALKTLDEGIARLGPLSTLQEAAIDIELQSANTEGAISRLDTLIALGKRREYLLYRKAGILALAHRPGEAKRYYEEALAAIGTLQPARRHTKPLEKLKADIEAGLRALQVKS